MTSPAQSRQLGRQGEEAAAAWLAALGWTIVERNWHCRYGEIDIVAREGEELVFVEVKSRRSADPADAFAQVERRKQAKMALAAEEYLVAHKLSHDLAWRIDVIAVVFGAQQPIIEHARDALLW